MVVVEVATHMMEVVYKITEVVSADMVGIEDMMVAMAVVHTMLWAHLIMYTTMSAEVVVNITTRKSSVRHSSSIIKTPLPICPRIWQDIMLQYTASHSLLPNK
jgi:hypothetical protein